MPMTGGGGRRAGPSRGSAFSRVPIPLVAAALVAVLSAACSSPRTSAAPPTTPTLPTTTSTTTTLPPTTTTTTEEPGWTPVSSTAAGFAVDERTVAASDGTPITVARFRVGRTRFDLHVGSTDPPTGGAALSTD